MFGFGVSAVPSKNISADSVQDRLLTIISVLTKLSDGRLLDLTLGVPDEVMKALANPADTPPSSIIGEYTERCSRRNTITRKKVESIIADLRSILGTLDIARGTAVEFQDKIIHSASTDSEKQLSGYLKAMKANEQPAGSRNKRPRSP